MQNVKIDREKYIGGSDIPAIMGISPFKKRFDLLLEKAQLQEDAFEGNEYTEYGNELEPKIRDYINKSEKKKFVEDKVIKDDLRYHSDGFNGKCVLEIKTTSQIHDDVDGYKIYLVQLLFGMQMHDVKKGKLAVYERPEDFNSEFDALRLTTYDIDIKDYKDLLEDINFAVDQFRKDLAKLKENPFLTEEDLQPKEIIELSNQVIEFEQKLIAFKVLEDKYKALKEQLFNAMAENQIKKWTTNNGVQITRVDGSEDKIVTIDKFNEDKFKTDHADIYEQYVEQVEQTKKGRSGYLKITLPKGE